VAVVRSKKWDQAEFFFGPRFLGRDARVGKFERGLKRKVVAVVLKNEREIG
jgi:hypothetical protein